jgi:endo-1,4-beta-xylanase
MRIGQTSSVVAFGLTFVLVLTVTLMTRYATGQEVTPSTLRSGAERLGFAIGSAVELGALAGDPTYSDILAREFNVITAEDAMKFGALRPTRFRFDFANADAIVNFATAHKMKVRGHTLVWHHHLSPWLIDGHFSASQYSTILRQHIETVVGHFRGRIYTWDVVNEAIDDDGRLRQTPWSEMSGANYIAEAFKWAHAADPHAMLFYNDYGGEALGRKSDAIYELVRSLKMRGIPIDGIGLQSHFVLEALPNMSDVAENMRRLAALGLKIHITEFDVSIALPATGQKLKDQANFYSRYLRTCLSIENCTAFLSWGFTDRYSWIPHTFEGKGAALPFDEGYRPKPAYQALMDVLDSAQR